MDGPDGGSRLVLGHGAGGGGAAPDLLAARAVALELGLQVVRVEQPWRVAGRRVAAPAGTLDIAWLAVVNSLPPAPTVLGGRSSGARVACRTADAIPRVVGVLCLAFPLQPPRRGADRPQAPSRAAELTLPTVPRLVVQGERDPFGVPECAAGVEVYVVAGADHSLAARPARGRTASQVAAEVREAVRPWLAQVLGGGGRPPVTD